MFIVYRAVTDVHDGSGLQSLAEEAFIDASRLRGGAHSERLFGLIIGQIDDGGC